MRLFLDQDNQIARGPSAFAGITLATKTELHAFLHARGDINGYHLLPINPAFPFAIIAFGSDHAALAVTGRTGGDGLHLPQESARHFSYLAGAAAGAAALISPFIFRPYSTAHVTGHVFLYLDLFIRTFCNLFIIEPDLHP